MNSTGELMKSETVARLAAAAAANGFGSIDEFVEQRFPDSTANEQAAEKPLYETLSPEELAEAFVQWARSHNHKAPALTLEDVSHESIYEDRW